MFLFCSFIEKNFTLVNHYVGQYAFGKQANEKLKENMKKIIVLFTLLLMPATANAESKLQSIKKKGRVKSWNDWGLGSNVYERSSN